MTEYKEGSFVSLSATKLQPVVPGSVKLQFMKVDYKQTIGLAVNLK